MFVCLLLFSAAIIDWTTRFRLFLPNSTSGISLGRRSLDDDRERIYSIIEGMMYKSVFNVDWQILKGLSHI